MSKGKHEGATGAKSAKRKNNRKGGGDEELLHHQEPGVGKEFVHLAQAYIGRDNDTATELTRNLNAIACRRVGVYRRTT